MSYATPFYYAAKAVQSHESPSQNHHPLPAVWPTEDGYFGVDVRWHGRECILRAVVVRRMLVEAGIQAHPGNSQDGRIWELRVGPVPADEVARVIESYIW
jgi:hypothetical protein